MGDLKKIVVQNLTMIYGKNIKQALELYTKGENAEEIYKKAQSVVAVKNVSFDVYEHELLVIMGLSGSGKSSLLKCLNLLNIPSIGSIYVDGEDIGTYDKKSLEKYRREKISMVFQNFGLLPYRTALENVEFGMEVCGIDKWSRRKKALEVIKMVGLEGWENCKPKELSGGMQQRVGLARALANDPEILIMDEPFSALDPLIRNQMQHELLRIQEALNKTIVFITHDINEAFVLGDRIAIMKDGEIQQIGKPCEILESPKTEYVEEFIKDINRFKVYKAKDVMKDNSDGLEYSDYVTEETSVEKILKILMCNDMIGVKDRTGKIIGRVDRESVLKVFI